ncbi:cellulose binding domain-containing protein [Streptomyces sp. NPDC002537]
MSATSRRFIVGLCTTGVLATGMAGTAAAVAPSVLGKTHTQSQKTGATSPKTDSGLSATGKLSGGAWYKNGEFDITNNTGKPVGDWTIEFDLAGSSSFSVNYGAEVKNSHGNHWVVKAGTGGTVQPGQKAQFSFGIGGDGKSDVSLTNTTINGQPFSFDSGTKDAQDDKNVPLPKSLEAGKTWASDSTIKADLQANTYPGGSTVNAKISNPDHKAIKNWTVAYGVDPGTKIQNPWGADIKLSQDQTMVIIRGTTLQPNGGDGGSIGFSTQYDPNDPTSPEIKVKAAKNPHLAKSAPYVDPTLGLGDGTLSIGGKTVKIADYLKQTGADDVTLAFLQADPKTKAASWAGSYSTHNYLAKQINEIRDAGHDVVASFGGANGTTLAQANQDVDKLAKDYEDVITRYKLTKIDFDMEGSAQGNNDYNKRNGKALAKVQEWAKKNNQHLWISATLPVLPSGLVDDGKGSLKSMTDAGVDVSRVNIMQMDYGDSAYDPKKDGSMADASIKAGENLKNQLKEFFPKKSDKQLYGMIGFTPMIGVNDTTDEIFTLDDAKKLRQWADQHGVGMMSMWSGGRDQPGRPGPDASGTHEKALAFSKILFEDRT